MTDPSTTSSIDPIPSANGAHPPHVVGKDSAYRATTEAAELLRADAGDLNAERVDMDRSGAEQIAAERVSLVRSGAKSIDAKSAQLDNSGALSLSAESVVLHKSSAIAVNAKTARIVKSRIMLFRSDMTTIEGEVRTLIHVGQACDNVKPVLNGASALSFGAALGAVVLIGGRMLRRLFDGR